MAGKTGRAGKSTGVLKTGNRRYENITDCPLPTGRNLMPGKGGTVPVACHAPAATIGFFPALPARHFRPMISLKFNSLKSEGERTQGRLLRTRLFRSALPGAGAQAFIIPVYTTCLFPPYSSGKEKTGWNVQESVWFPVRFSFKTGAARHLPTPASYCTHPVHCTFSVQKMLPDGAFLPELAKQAAASCGPNRFTSRFCPVRA